MRNEGRRGRLIAIAGRAGSGKDTVASLLPGAERFPFAGPMKDFCRQVYDFSHDQVWGPSEMRNAPDSRYPRAHGPWIQFALSGGRKCACCGAVDGKETADLACYLTPRFALQTLGTEWGRTCFQDTWATMAVRQATKALDQGAPFAVIPDCRFTNEARIVREAGGEVWHVSRPTGSQLSEAASMHPSEREQTSPEFQALVTCWVKNNGTLNQLCSAVLDLIGWPDSL